MEYAHYRPWRNGECEQAGHYSFTEFTCLHMRPCAHAGAAGSVIDFGSLVAQAETGQRFSMVWDALGDQAAHENGEQSGLSLRSASTKMWAGSRLAIFGQNSGGAKDDQLRQVQYQGRGGLGADVGAAQQAAARKRGATIGPTEPTSAEPNPDAAPTAALRPLSIELACPDRRERGAAAL
ncbi:hypothetical protein [Streptomyces sp. NPDC055400]